MAKKVVGVGDMIVSGDPHDEITTYALGSCLGITIYDPVAKVGGMLHVMLPESNIDTEKAKRNPYMFVDTGLPMLFRKAYELGCNKHHVILKVSGGSSMPMVAASDSFQIGKRNIMAVKKMLWKNNVMIQGSDVGGNVSRNMTLNMETGEVSVKIGSETVML